MRGSGCPKCWKESIKITKENFIAKARKIYGNKYCYDLVEIIDSRTKIKIICPIHGVFEQNYNCHYKNGCPKCGYNAILTKEQVIERANIKHNFKYSYENVVYTGSVNKINITCKLHGIFQQSVDSHIYGGHGCPKCSTGVLLTQSEYIEKCKRKHGDTYDYSAVVFKGVKKKVKIGCKVHGLYEQIAEKHFEYGCPACAGNKRSNTQEFIDKAKIVHNNRYTYEFCDYKCSTKKVCICCPTHKKFFQASHLHLRGEGCPKCFGSNSKKEMKWLDILNIPDTPKYRNVIHKVDGRKFVFDGYYCGIVFEFLGDFWHANPSIYKSDDYNKATGTTFGELFDKTIEKIRFLRDRGFKVICIWEKTFDRKYAKAHGFYIPKKRKK